MARIIINYYDNKIFGNYVHYIYLLFLLYMNFLQFFKFIGSLINWISQYIYIEGYLDITQ